MKYEMCDGWITSYGLIWQVVDDKTAEIALEQAAEFEKIDRIELEKLLNDGSGVSARTGKQSPNYYYDHGVEQIRSASRPEPKTELVKCACGHSVPRENVMNASMGSSCVDCYDRMSS